jgi:hypothetical protein
MKRANASKLNRKSGVRWCEHGAPVAFLRRLLQRRIWSAGMMMVSTAAAAAHIGSVTGIVSFTAGSVEAPLGGIANKPYSATVKTTGCGRK